MTEQILTIAAAAIVFAAAVLRLNVLQAKRHRLHFWGVIEVLGLSALMGGCAGTIGEWFLPMAQFHSETVIIVAVAMVAAGVSRGQLCEVVARLQGWDGGERRKLARPSALDSVDSRFELRR